MDPEHPEQEYHPDPKSANTVHDSGAELNNIMTDAISDEAKSAAKSSSVNTAAQPVGTNLFTEEIKPVTTATVEAPAKKKHGKLIALIVAVILLLCGGGACAGFMIWRSQPAVMAMDAMVNFLNTTTIQSNGTLTVDFDNGAQQGKATFAFDAEGAGLAHRFSGTLSISVDGITQKLAFKEAFTQEREFYFQIEGIQDTIDGLSVEVKEGIEPMLNMFSETIELVDGTWWRVSIPEVLDSLKDQLSARDRQRYENLYNCAMDAVEKGGKSGELAEVYKKHPFVTIEKYEGAAFKDVKETLYKVDFKVNEARGFIKEDFTTLTVYKDLKTCLAEVDVDLDQQTENVETNLDDGLSSSTDVVWAVAIDGWSHKLTGVYISVANDDSSSQARAEVHFTYPSKVEISAPADSRPVKDLLEQITTDFSNMSNMMYTGFDDYYYEYEYDEFDY